MQFETILKTRTPRCACKTCGVKTVEVPWAGKHSRFTLMFEAFAIEVMQACANVKQAAALLRLDWDTVHSIMERAVNRGLERRSLDNIQHVGIDEKSFLSGHNYVSVMPDIDGSRVLEVAEGRKEVSADRLWKSLSPSHRGTVRAVSMDMWQAFISSTEKYTPFAAIVFDRFHISKHLNEAVEGRRNTRQVGIMFIDRARGNVGTDFTFPPASIVRASTKKAVTGATRNSFFNLQATKWLRTLRGALPANFSSCYEKHHRPRLVTL